MLDLKPYHDAVIETDAEVKHIANDIDAHFQEGTDEAKEKALALRPALDEAQNKADEALKLYESLKKAARPSDVAKNFVPVSTTQPDPEASETPGTMKRPDFEVLNAVEKRKFVLSGGKVVDQ
jgi:ElaB/YqjD/DUF883 family membrane-anchored ribosome-binding protein